MPGVFQLSWTNYSGKPPAPIRWGVPAVLLFGIPERKDERASSGAYARNGIVQQAVRLLKRELPDLLVITDVCLCEYMSHGHCGLVRADKRGATIVNDATLNLLAFTATSHAEAGADIIAPSDMMDGRVRAIRTNWTRLAFPETPIMSSRRSLRRRFTDRSARRRNPHPNLATAGVTRWMPPMPTRRCAKLRWTSEEGRTS